MKVNCNELQVFHNNFIAIVYNPPRQKKMIFGFWKGEGCSEVRLKMFSALNSSGMMKRKIIEKLGMNEKKYALCLMLAGFAALNTGFTSQSDEIQSAEVTEVIEVEQVPSEVAQVETKSEVNEIVQEEVPAENTEPEEPVNQAEEVITVEPVEEPAQNNIVENVQEDIDYANVLSMEASAYLPGDGNGAGITATGIRAGYGVAAVDPSIIPLGTRLYIPGYGEAVAADTGGAIRGYMIDLCMESYAEAMQFGRRNVTVYVLDY